MVKNKISIIIPVLNEAENIITLLDHLKTHSFEANLEEVIIVDGGSTDGSLNLISNYSSFSENNFCPIILIHSPKGRAKQMNTGAELASGSILYFLHADSFPPKYFDKLIINEVNKGNKAGCFRLEFNSKHWWLILAGWLTKFNWRVSRGGDQSQYITKTLFKAIGGYDERYIIYEDNILINELYKRKIFKVIQHNIKTSARLYEKKGIWNLQFHFWAIYVKKWFGASALELHQYYLKHIVEK